MSDKHEPSVEITVDGNSISIRPGVWLVKDLKAAANVDPARVLAEITPHGLKDLDDDGKTSVHPGQRFMSHVRTGASS